MISKVLTKTGATVRYCGIIYKAVARTLLPYGRKSWGVKGVMLKILAWFCHRSAIRIAGMMGKRMADGTWEYPVVVAALEESGLYPI